MREYLTDQVELQRVVSRNGYGEATTANSNIMVRYEDRLKRVKTTTGAEIIATARIFSMDEIHAGNLIKRNDVTREVLAVQSQSLLDGDVVLWEAYL